MKFRFFIFFLISEVAFAQWSDDFSDGDFTNNQSWQGNTENFIVENGWLRLSASGASTSYLSVESDVAIDASWEFVFKMDFTPSSSNYAKVYLISDREMLNDPLLNGYYLRLGYTDRDISLFRQNGNINEKILASRTGILNAASNHVRVSVTRDRQGNWTLKTAIGGGHDFTVEGSAQDSHTARSAYFGVVCTYTTTRSNGFYFSDFRVEGQPYTDTRPPKILSHSANSKQVHLEFSKSLAAISKPFERFFVVDDRMNLYDALTDETAAITLLFADEIKCGLRYQLTIKELEDTNGVRMRDTTIYISMLCSAVPFDIVIGEIMANPSNPVRLPEFEYVELYNRSDKNIEIGGWTFSYGNTVRTLPACLFPAGGYVLLAHPSAVADLSGYGTTLPVFGSLTAIANAGQYLQLRDSEGNVISWVDFNDDWYGESLKSNGGWSLEQINPELNCSVESNWKASISGNGGTPGQKNSVHSPVSQIKSPEIIRIAAPDINTVLLYVSNPLGNNLPDVSQFSMTPEVESVEIAGTHFDRLQLKLQSPLREGEWYDLAVTGNIPDCAGYYTPRADFHFSMPQYIDSLDVIINEIMFNPTVGSYSYVELYNRSQKAVQVNDLQLSLRNANGELSNPVPLTDEPFLLMPGQYLVVSRNVEYIMQQYMVSNLDAFLQMRRMPALTRTSGRIVLLNKSLRIIDEVHYSSSQHSDFLNSGSGVSLERINPDRSSLDAGNWHTAAQTAGFATPGYKNSQYMDIIKTAANEVSLYPEVFSPNNDGMDDLLNIAYCFDYPSLMGEVIIFDSAGRIIRRLVSRQLLSAEGTITWDGTDDRGRRALTGVYVVYFHAFNSNGIQRIYRIPCVLADKRQ